MTDTTDGALSDPNITPPMGQAIPLGIQHVLAMFASNVTPSIIVAGAAGFAFGGEDMTYLIQMAMLFAGIATLFQTVGFGRIGARLPIMQGTSFAFVSVLVVIAANDGMAAMFGAIVGWGIIMLWSSIYEYAWAMHFVPYNFVTIYIPGKSVDVSVFRLIVSTGLAAAAILGIACYRFVKVRRVL